MIACILFLFYLTIVVTSFKRWPLFRNSGLSFQGLTTLFFIRLICGIAVLLIYTYYYTDRGMADIYKYYDDANAIYGSISLHPGAAFHIITGIGFDPANAEIREVLASTHHFDKQGSGLLEANHHLIIRMQVLFRLFSYGCIYIHALFFSFLGFIGAIALYRVLKLFFSVSTGQLLIAPLFFMPSILFWSSGMLQETLILFFIGILFFAVIKVVQIYNVFTNLILTLLSLNFLYLCKPFIALSFIISLYVMGIFYFRSYVRALFITIAIVACTWLLVGHQALICDLMAALIHKRNEFTALGLKMKAGSLADTRIMPIDCAEPLRLISSGFYNLFFRPFISSSGLFEKLFGLENLFVLLVTLFTFVHFKMPKGPKLTLAAFSISFFILNYLLIGITVPIIGALVRYKIFGLLFYLILMICLINFKKIISVHNVPSFLEKWLFKMKS